MGGWRAPVELRLFFFRQRGPKLERENSASGCDARHGEILHAEASPFIIAIVIGGFGKKRNHNAHRHASFFAKEKATGARSEKD
jgi:hypothetical protein